jgi:hypothetical protein
MAGKGAKDRVGEVGHLKDRLSEIPAVIDLGSDRPDSHETRKGEAPAKGGDHDDEEGAAGEDPGRRGLDSCLGVSDGEAPPSTTGEVVGPFLDAVPEASREGEDNVVGLGGPRRRYDFLVAGLM